jgi:hypothetical protein
MAASADPIARASELSLVALAVADAATWARSQGLSERVFLLHLRTWSRDPEWPGQIEQHRAELEAANAWPWRQAGPERPTVILDIA